jgi:hypothetical protein
MLNQCYAPFIDPELMRNPMTQAVMPIPLKLARAYVPNQPYTGLFQLDMALRVGTLFPNMYEAFPKIR